MGGWRDVDDELDGWRDDLDKSLLKTNELIEQLAGLTQDTRTHGTHFVMEGVERGNHL